MVFEAKLNWWNNHKSRQFFWTRTKGKLSKRATMILSSLGYKAYYLEK